MNMREASGQSAPTSFKEEDFKGVGCTKSSHPYHKVNFGKSFKTVRPSWSDTIRSPERMLRWSLT